MNPIFEEIVNKLDPKLDELLSSDPLKPTSLPKNMPEQGIYLFSEGEKHLYVGRSRNIKKRIGKHSRPGATYKMAAFAFRLAREETGYIKPTYKPNGSRKDLMDNPEFKLAFDNAKARIRKMDVRFVDESDPLRQTLLEIYVAVSLTTPYNEFRTH